MPYHAKKFCPQRNKKHLPQRILNKPSRRTEWSDLENFSKPLRKPIFIVCTWKFSIMKTDNLKSNRAHIKPRKHMNRAYLGIFKNTIHWNFSSWIFGVRSVPSHWNNQSRKSKGFEIVRSLKKWPEILGWQQYIWSSHCPISA